MVFSASEASVELAPGALFAGFTVEAELGRGAHGVVYAARASDGSRVALKLMAGEARGDPDLVLRFEREARALKGLSHRAIARVMASGRAPDGTLFIATERLDGGSLRGWCGAPRAAREAWGVLREVAEALGAAHSSGVVHRDVKPDNVMLTGEGEVRLIDFGLCREDAPASAATAPALTGAGAPLGTPAYMPPEQWWNDGVGPATDQYALAATMFELCTGKPLFKGDSYVSLMQSHLSCAPPSFADAGLALSVPCEAWLSRALAKSPAERFGSMSELRAAGDLAFGLRVAPTVPTRRVSRASVLALFAVASSMVLLGYAGSRDPRQWVHMSGGAAWLTLGVFFFSALASVLRPTPLPLWVSLVPAALGSLGAYTGLHAVFSAMPGCAASRQFETFNAGISECDANRFLGLGCSVALLFSELVKTRVPELGPRARRETLSLAVALLALAACALAASAPSGMFISLVASAAVCVLGGAQPSLSRELPRSINALALSLGALSLSLTRVEARAAVSWSVSPSRSARAAEITAALGERQATLGLSLLGFLAVALVVSRRLRGAAGRQPFAWRTPRMLLGLGVLTLYVSLEAFVALDVRSHRQALWEALAPRFSLFARLDPPSMGARALPLPTVGVCLQISRDTLALDGEAVGLVRALASSPEALSVLSVDLSHALARAGEGRVLMLMIDRSVRWETVRRALGVAYAVGARSVELLLTRGVSPRLTASAPREAGYVLPRDFGALSLGLSLEGGEVFSREASMDDLTAGLLRAGARVLRVDGR